MSHNSNCVALSQHGVWHLSLLLFNICTIFLHIHLRWFLYWGCAKQLRLQGKACLLNAALPSHPASTSVAWNAVERPNTPGPVQIEDFFLTEIFECFPLAQLKVMRSREGNCSWGCRELGWPSCKESQDPNGAAPVGFSNFAETDSINA